MTKLAGIISLLFCSSAMAAVSVSEVANETAQTNAYPFGPFATAMDTASGATTTASITQAYAQPFWYDLGAQWTYNEYCTYNSNICETLWDGTPQESLSDGIDKWRQNILNTFILNSGFSSESDAVVSGAAALYPTADIGKSSRITAIYGSDVVGYQTIGGDASDQANNIARQGFYNDRFLKPVTLADDLNGFTSAYDFADVTLPGFSTKTIIVGQSSVSWADRLPTDAKDTARFSACYSAALDDDRSDFDDLYYCPGFNLQAAFWDASNPASANLMATKWLSDDTSTFSNNGTEEASTYTANAYAINTSGYAVGFTTENINSNDNGGYNWATIFTPAVSGATLTYTPKELINAGTGFDYKDEFLNTVAIDITDTVYNAASKAFTTADGSANKQAFLVLGNRKVTKSQNGNRADEFYIYNVANDNVTLPLRNLPRNGANSRATKINNDGIVVGWRDDYGETNQTISGSPRFQAAFVYDYKTGNAAYLNDLYCDDLKATDGNTDNIKYRFTNAISVTDKDGTGHFTILANGYDYKNIENYKNKKNGTPVVLRMTLNESDIASDAGTQQCPVLESEDYKRKGAGMNAFILFPMLLIFFRRFKR